VSIKTLAAGSASYPGQIGRIELVGRGGPLNFTREAGALVVTLPDQRPADFVATLKISSK
jgi:hypothetical protein